MSIINPPLLPGIALALQGTVVQGPEGPRGPDGLSAYQVWLAQGNTGTVADFLAALIGEQGSDGRSIELQKSATHIQWRLIGDPVWIDLVPLVDLKGADGANGTNGIDGVDGTDGVDGEDGRGIVSIIRTLGSGSPGETDTYTITYTSGPESYFYVTNGYDGVNGADGANGNDGLNGNDGRGIVSVARTSGTGAAGTFDTYTITYTDASTSTFQIYNGADGGGSGDMLKSVYDPNNDGKVSAADTADAVPWSGVTGKPIVIAAGADAAAARAAIDAVSSTALSSLESATATALADKVDKVAGKGLSEADFTSGEKAKLAGIAAGATANLGTVTSVGGTAPIESSGGTTPVISISPATTSNAGSMSAADKSKLDGIAAGATANVGDVTLSGAQTLSNKTFTNAYCTPIEMPANDIDLSLGSVFSKTFTANATLTFSNAGGAGKVTFFILHAKNAGAYTVNLPAGIIWEGGVVPTLSTAGEDALAFYNTGSGWRGHLIGKDFK